MSIASFTLGTIEIKPGTRLTVDLPVSVLSNHTPITLPVHVIHGASPGPTMFISAAVHGDEILGVEIVRRVVRHSAIADLHGAHFDIPRPVRHIECMIAPTSDGGIYYTGPSEDFTRPGRMWWAVPHGG